MTRKHLLYYASKLDCELQPLPLCTTNDGDEPKALILYIRPGTQKNLQRSLNQAAEMAETVAESGESAVVAMPCGRGPGSVYQGPGEVDLFEAVDFIKTNFNIDPDRVSVTGASMGGAGTWYLASHYPDVFSAAAPFAGYCDYRLWEKPGQTIMPTREWEHPSWQARGAAFRAGNLSSTALWIVHGEWDIALGGGVPVQHARNMSRDLKGLGIEHRYWEVPECGHRSLREDTMQEVIPWLARQVRRNRPEYVDLTAHTLRHSKSHYLQLLGFEVYGSAAHARADLKKEAIEVTEVHNTNRIGLGPFEGKLAVSIGNQSLGQIDLNRAVVFRKEKDAWSPESELPSGIKRPGSSGPIGDLFFESLRIVQGTGGNPQESFLQDWLMNHWRGIFKSKNGGIHRGDFDGESNYTLQTITDEDCTEQIRQDHNLILLGTPHSNSVWKSISDTTPAKFDGKRLAFRDKIYEGPGVGFCALMPSPFREDRYVLTVGGLSPEAITGSSHLNLQLLPDYVIWDGGRVLDWGFFDGHWR